MLKVSRKIITVALMATLLASGAVAVSGAKANTVYAADKAIELKIAGVKPKTNVEKDSVTVLGDSVVFNANYYGMGKAIAGIKGISTCKVDAKFSRQLSGKGKISGIKALKSLKKKGKLGSIVVIGLATNIVYMDDYYKDAKKARSICGSARYVVFINGYNRGSTNWIAANKAIAKLAKKDPKVYVADWHKLISGKTRKHLADGRCHLTSTSAKWYTSTVVKQVKAIRAVKQKARNKELNKAKVDSADLSIIDGDTASLTLTTKKLASWAYQIKANVTTDGDKVTGSETLEFLSSKPSIATVDSKGVIRAVKKGSTTITVRYANLTEKIDLTVG